MPDDDEDPPYENAPWWADPFSEVIDGCGCVLWTVGPFLLMALVLVLMKVIDALELWVNAR